MQALILAGGFGTRLKDILPDLPKPLAPIDNVPFLLYLLTHLSKHNINNVTLLTGYKSEAIENFIQNVKLSINIEIIKENMPLGTAGALFNAWNKLEPEFYLINGDSYFDADLSLLDNYFRDKSIFALLALRYSQDAARYGNVNFNDEFKVTSFIEKNTYSNNVDCFINAGLYKFNKSILTSHYNSWDGGFLSIENSIFPKMVEEGILYGLPVGGLFIDIGIAEDYRKANVIIPNRIAETVTPALFLDRDNLLIEDNGYTYGTDLKFLTKADTYIKKANTEKQPVIVVSNQSGVARGYFLEEDVMITNNVVKTNFLNKGLVINDFYYCPYHPDGKIEKYKKFSYSRKPYPGMILSACEKYKIDLKGSLMIGDNPVADNIKLPYLNCKII
ncbi:MAG: HAD-IIIA family hydrolase [Deferribacteraceae bacterium]|nr:HAD-IIIA family hydrolase [Deferribacteraceae bacterium]